MNPIDTNKDTKTKIQTPTPGGNDNVKSNQGGNETNQQMDTTKVIQRGETRRTQVTIKIRFNTRAIILWEAMIL